MWATADKGDRVDECMAANKAFAIQVLQVSDERWSPRVQMAIGLEFSGEQNNRGSLRAPVAGSQHRFGVRLLCAEVRRRVCPAVTSSSGCRRANAPETGRFALKAPPFSYAGMQPHTTKTTAVAQPPLGQTTWGNLRWPWVGSLGGRRGRRLAAMRDQCPLDEPNAIY